MPLTSFRLWRACPMRLENVIETAIGFFKIVVLGVNRISWGCIRLPGIEKCPRKEQLNKSILRAFFRAAHQISDCKHHWGSTV